jgi:hypothetical protein
MHSNAEWGRTCKEVAVALFEALARYLPRVTQKNHENCDYYKYQGRGLNLRTLEHEAGGVVSRHVW